MKSALLLIFLIFLILLIPLSASAQQAPAPASEKLDLAAEARKTLSKINGQMLVPGLEHPVNVLRDRWGVAHIYAQNQHDLFFAQGIVAAQDRLFQMELWKRAGQGRLAEILGPSALPRDINARALRYRGDMQTEYASYAPDTQAILTAFTDGINFYIASLTSAHGPGVPIEFQLAGFSPDPWTPEDCLNRLAAFSMTGNALSELEHAQALNELGPHKAALLFNFDPKVALDPAPHLDLAGLSPELLTNLIGSDHRIEFPARPLQESNNWTISGSLTSTGEPLLANDPHRVIGLPSLRYMIHLVAPGWNVIGAGEPGLPGVALGHNEHIAWGFTIFGLDQQDLYVEELNPSNPLEYKTETGWKAMEISREKFLVKGALSKEIDLQFTRNGPVLWNDGKRAIALRWVGTEPGTAGYLASLSIDRAANWDQFESAVARWKVPSENLVYADDAGNIGEHSAGLAPKRSWTGLLPVPDDGKYNWAGFIPTSDLPHFFNPKEGFVATANNKMIPESYPYDVGFEWAPAYRVTRIRSVIENAKDSKRPLTVLDMESLQADVTSLPALEFQKMLLSTALNADPTLANFLHWDGRLTRESSDAALYEVWYQQICIALARRFSKEHGARYSDLSPDTMQLLLSNPDRLLFGDDPTTARDQLLRDTLHTAREHLTQLLGSGASQWSWGKMHSAHFRHALDQQAGGKDLFDLGPLPRPGDESTVNATGTEGDSWEQSSGASYREILDTSDWDLSIAVNTPGQSGQPGSPHYSDLMTLWDAGQYFSLVYSRKAVELATTDRLLLQP